MTMIATDMRSAGPGDVAVWVAPLDAGPPTSAMLGASLSPAERARAARYRFPDGARRFSAARGWLRHILAAELKVAPEEVPLSEGPGKPRILEGAGPYFSVSHAGDMALIAVAGTPVGVDLEHGAAGLRGIDAVKLACTPAERAALQGLPSGRRAEAFLCSWTAKEAFVKATGQGLGVVAPSRVEVGTRWAQLHEPVLVDGRATPPPRWWARHLRPAAGYVGAVVAEGRGWAVTLRAAAESVVDRGEWCRR